MGTIYSESEHRCLILAALHPYLSAYDHGPSEKGETMIVVRNIFQLKFGQAKQATELWKQAMAAMKGGTHSPSSSRLLTDLAGPPYYTIIFESTFDSLTQFEQFHQAAGSNTAFRDLYAKIIPLTETGRREILTVLA